MHEKEYRFIEEALLKQRVTIRRTPKGPLVLRKGGTTIGFLYRDPTSASSTLGSGG